MILLALFAEAGLRKTRCAKGPLAVAAGPFAAGANGFLTTAAAIRACVTAERVAPNARAEAVPTKQVSATVAGVLVILTKDGAAIGAGASVPFGERDVSTARVVGVENAAHELEEVE